jgi:hypothetical protein
MKAASSRKVEEQAYLVIPLELQALLQIFSGTILLADDPKLQIPILNGSH